MADILAEVDEALRQERLEKLWKEHSKTFIALIALTILATAAISGYRSWNDHTNAQGTTKLIALLEAPDFPENIRDSSLDMRGGLKGIALVTAGSAFIEQGKKEEALALYEKAANDKSITGSFQQLATLMSVRLLSEKETDAAHLLARLEPIWSDKESPWRFHAHLETASLYANLDQDFAKAREHLNIIQDAQSLPDTLQAKARALDHIYSLREQQRKPKTTDKDS